MSESDGVLSTFAAMTRAGLDLFDISAIEMRMEARPDLPPDFWQAVVTILSPYASEQEAHEACQRISLYDGQYTLRLLRSELVDREPSASGQSDNQPPANAACSLPLPVET